MKTLLILLIIGLVRAQLNFEGNPLTENNDYKAEESIRSYRRIDSDKKEERVQRLYPIYENKKTGNATVKNESSTARAQQSESTARQYDNRQQNYRQTTTDRVAADVALQTFLNSKTPEESQLSLDYYLKTAEIQPAGNELQNNLQTSDGTNVESTGNQLTSRVDSVGGQTAFASPLTSSNVQMSHYAYHQQQSLQNNGQMHQYAYPQQQNLQNSQSLQSNTQMHQYPYKQQAMETSGFGQTAQRVPTGHDFMANGAGNGLTAHANFPLLDTPVMPYRSAMNAMIPVRMGMPQKGDFLPSAQWRQRMRRVRKPYAPIQPKIGAGFYKGPMMHGPLAPFSKPPVEVIYTRPPGFGHAHPPGYISNPPVAYEDASAYFPDADYPPPTKDVYYSQLYAQSYDPHYYNYIAKTGKIKPHLYGKFDKQPHNDDIWSDLYQGFKKHGLKNLMTPTFLLGMTIPAITMILTALVQKRSLARSDTTGLPHEEAINDYLDQLRRAMACYEQKSRRKRDTSTSLIC